MRASARPLAVICPSSSTRASCDVEAAREASEQGTLAHDLTRSAIKGEENWQERAEIDSAAINTDKDEVTKLVNMALAYWSRTWEQGAIREHLKLEEGFTHEGALGGHADARWLQPGEVSAPFVLDWKFGRVRSDCYHQLAQYAYDYRGELRAAGLWRDDMEITTVARWPRLGEEERRVFSGEVLDKWYEYVLSREAKAGQTYAPGDHCGFCPHRLGCTYRQQWLHTTTVALTEQHTAAMTDLTSIGALYEPAKALKRLLDDYNAALDSLLDAGEEVPLPNGKVLRRELQPRDQYDLRAAWPVLKEEGFTAADISTIASISKGAVEKVVKAKVPAGAKRGAKKQAWDAFQERLNEAGAVCKTYRKQKKEVDPDAM